MPLTPARSLHIVAVVAAISSVTFAANADGDVKQACVDASTEGQSLRDAGKLRQARDRFVSCASDECPAIVRKYCKEWLADVDRRAPTVIFRVRSAEGQDVADATLTVDGARQPLDSSAPIVLDAGAHAVHATGPNGEAIDERVVLVEGEQGRVVVLRFPSAAAATTSQHPAPSTDVAPEPTAGGFTPVTTVALVVGALGIAGFTYFGLKARSDLSNLRDTCAPFCASSDLSSVKTQALAADIALGIGVVAIGVATYSFFSHREAPAAASLFQIRPRIGGATIGLGSSF